jgi:GT2 family glycosyltransferase
VKPKVGVVIVTHNRKQVLENCLTSVLESTYENYVIIVIDNASTDNSFQMVSRDFPSVKAIRSELNLGYTGGNNLGITYALQNEKCNYLLILNDDTVVTQNLINNLLNSIEKNKRIGVVNPKILDFETKRDICNRYGEHNYYFGVGYKSLLDSKKAQEINLLRGTCFIIRKEVVEKIGLMDENYFLYFDEADLSSRVTNSKYKIVYEPTAIVYHQISQSFNGKVNPVVLYYSTRNELLFARKHLNMLFFFPLWAFRFAFRLIIYAIRTRDLLIEKSILQGFIDFTKSNFGKKEIN